MEANELKAGAEAISGMADEIVHGRARARQRKRERTELNILVRTSDGWRKLIVALGVLAFYLSAHWCPF